MTLGEMIQNLGYVIHKSQMATLELGDEGARQLLRWLEDYKELKELTRWIPCRERMPEVGSTILILFENQIKVSRLEKSKLGFLMNGEFIGKNLVTHWMPLPDPPKGDAE